MELKDEIIDGVIEEFNEKGLKFTMDDISRRLGMSKRTLYTYVEDKETLFIEMVDYVFTAIKESEKAIINDNSLDVVDKIKKILIVLPAKYKTLDYRQLYDLKIKFPRTYAKIENRLETDWEATLELLNQAMKEGKIRQISLPIFQAIISGTIENFLSRTILIDNGITYENALVEMLDIIINGMLV